MAATTGTGAVPKTSSNPLHDQPPISSAALPPPLTITIRNPTWAYLHLEYTTTTTPSTPTTHPLDSLTARTSLTAALSQFLGLTGAAMPIDLLKVEGRECWVRVSREDLTAVTAAVGGWVGRDGGSGVEVGWRVRGKGNWLASLIGEDLERSIWRD